MLQQDNTELDTFLKEVCPHGPKRIPLVKYDTQGFLEPSINRRILGGSYQQQIQDMLSGGGIWCDKIYCCHPFEVVLTDFSLHTGDVQRLKNDKSCPNIIKRSGFNFSGEKYYRGDWINYLKDNPISGDQIELFASIFGFNKDRAIEELATRLKIDVSESENVFFQRPHGFSRIRALYNSKDQPKIMDKIGLKSERSYCFLNANGSVKGWGQKVSYRGETYIACVTPWRSRRNHADCIWMPFGFENPYPFYGMELLEKYPTAEIILTEDMDAAYEFRNKLKQEPERLLLSWLGGKDSVANLDWKSLADRKVSCLVTEDDEGKQLALLVCEAIKNAGGMVHKWIGSDPERSEINDTQGAIDRLLTGPPVHYWEAYATYHVDRICKWHEPDGEQDEKVIEACGTWFGEGLDEVVIEKQFLLKPFIRIGELVVIAAPNKTAKSFLAQDLSLALASGKGFGEQFSAPKVGRVTYLDAEMGADTIQSRDKLFAGLYGVPKGKVLYTISTTKLGRNINLTQKKDREWLEREIPNGTKLLVLDNLGKLMAAYGDGNQKQWRVIETWLRELNQRMGIILITHTTKTGAFVRGTGKILDDADTVVSLRRPEGWAHADGNIFEFHFEASRALHDEQLEPFSVKYSTKHGRLHREIKGVGEPFENVPVMLMLGLDEKDFKPLEVEILQLAYKQGEIRARDFISKEGYPSATAVTDAFNLLIEKELLQRKGTRGNTRYILAIPLE